MGDFHIFRRVTMHSGYRHYVPRYMYTPAFALELLTLEHSTMSPSSTSSSFDAEPFNVAVSHSHVGLSRQLLVESLRSTISRLEQVKNFKDLQFAAKDAQLLIIQETGQRKLEHIANLERERLRTGIAHSDPQENYRIALNCFAAKEAPQ